MGHRTTVKISLNSIKVIDNLIPLCEVTLDCFSNVCHMNLGLGLGK